MGIKKKVATAASKGSFEEATAVLEKLSDSSPKIATRQARELTVDAAQDFEAFYEQNKGAKPELKADAPNPLLVITTDAKGIKMRKEGLREATRKKAENTEHKYKKRLAKGEKSQAKRMAQVGAVYDIMSWIRTPDDIHKDLRPVRGESKKRPRPDNKRVWSSVQCEVGEFIAQIFEEARLRDPGQERSWVALVDGCPRQISHLKSEAKRLGVEMPIVLDIIHVIEYLWKAASCFFEEGDSGKEAWVTERYMSILAGNVSQVAAGIRRSATLRKIPEESREAVDECCTYLLNHKEYMRYDEYLAKGYPIATGVIEGACRHLIMDRMDLTGARWLLPVAEAVLKMRAIYSSGDSEAYWDFHFKQEQKRNHESRYAGGIIPSLKTPGESSGPSHLRLVK